MTQQETAQIRSFRKTDAGDPKQSVCLIDALRGESTDSEW